MPNKLLSIYNATITHRDQIIFEDLNFDWAEGEQWAILGNSGVEQTAFLDTLLGRTRVIKGEINRLFAEAYQYDMANQGKVNSFRDLLAVVSQNYVFKNKSNLQNFYYQQRFNSMESEEAATVLEFLEEFDGHSAEVGFWDKMKVIELMRLDELKNKSLIKLSNGETRRLAIAAALIKNPKLLLLDQPMTGLDLETRTDFGKILKAIADSGIHIIMATSNSELPDCISNVAFIENKKIDALRSTIDWRNHQSRTKTFEDLDKPLLLDLVAGKQNHAFERIIQLNDVNIRYDDRTILDHVNWTVLRGERWALKGPNGAGKSTLLSLVLGENPQAYANDIVLFDRKRGTGESIWDIKRHVGFVAPELSRYFPVNQTCLKVVLSGLFDTMGLFKKPKSGQEMLAKKWLTLFNLESLAEKRFNIVSLDDQRFILLARAMIKIPSLLILDEAAQGMDQQKRDRFKNAIDHICSSYSISLIYVSHYEEDIPDSVNKLLRLEKGAITNISY